MAAPSVPVKTPEQIARELLARLGFTEYRTNGDLVELANFINAAIGVRNRRMNVRTAIDRHDRAACDRLAEIVDRWLLE